MKIKCCAVRIKFVDYERDHILRPIVKKPILLSRLVDGLFDELNIYHKGIFINFPCHSIWFKTGLNPYIIRFKDENGYFQEGSSRNVDWW